MGIFKRTETQKDDDARTGRLLQGVEDAYAARTGDPVDGGPLTAFEHTIVTSAAPDPDTEYPPPGHSYPRR
ncbi:hypothetical protein [Streptomyces sp. AMCC400023]|uniref:hypothetical protein n=1 Tax=Streptomyces sp. AMCC400023 TaxID=2056258 RepID=UPI001F41DCB4|nr:hypothetical protein [Streptomyces sp. AMCC400023]UJV41608.1 hypothetical protein CVT30_18665 [Streptomyces sp. AMCC400023]